MWDFDEVAGKAIVPGVIADPGPSVQMAERALVQALAAAGLQGSDLDGLILTGCNPDQQNFSHDALLIHDRIGMRPEAFALVHDDGCGGAMFHLAMAHEMLLAGQRKVIAVVGVNAFSPHLDREVYSRKISHNGKELGCFLSFYLFGDGAGAIILRSDQGETPARSGVVGSYAANERLDLVLRRGGGTMWPAIPSRTEYSDPAFYVDRRPPDRGAPVPPTTLQDRPPGGLRPGP
jgi:3-oxoacyl-[acyl-carrier-protein] synthase III